MTTLGSKQARPRLPAWLREQRLNPGAGRRLRRLLRRSELSTVCEEARCPNLGQCFESGTATFMILGERCTRGCRFCNVSAGPPAAVDPGEPERLALAVQELKLAHVVITSVTRDDLADGGAGQFVAVIEALRRRCPQTAVEVLVPDFGGRERDVQRVLDARPDVFNHNVETVPRLYAKVRPGAVYQRSLDVLAQGARVEGPLVKSGLMVGLGETQDEVVDLLGDLAEHGVHVATIGQYLQPNLQALPVACYIEPERFEDLRQAGIRAGLVDVFAGPRVRSSYLADELRQRVLAHAIPKRRQT